MAHYESTANSSLMVTKKSNKTSNIPYYKEFSEILKALKKSHGFSYKELAIQYLYAYYETQKFIREHPDEIYSISMLEKELENI